MRSLTKGVFGAVLALSLLAPALTQAAGLTSTQISSVIGLLQSFGVDAKTITTVQMVLTNTSDHGTTWVTSSSTATGTPMLPPGQVAKRMCITLNRNLGIGSHGDDVKSLQELLSDDDDSDFHATPTGFFGPMTAKALARFQMNNRIASTSTGTVGPMTRGFFERHCGKGLGKEKGDDMKSGVFTGTIATYANPTLTVQNPKNMARLFTVTASTTIQVFSASSTSPTAGSTSDLIAGKTVAVKSVRNADGSLTALTINVGVLPPTSKHEDEEDDR